MQKKLVNIKFDAADGPSVPIYLTTYIGDCFFSAFVCVYY